MKIQRGNSINQAGFSLPWLPPSNSDLFGEILMRQLAAIMILMGLSTWAYAPVLPLPEPETLPLIAIGVVAFWIAGRKKRK